MARIRVRRPLSRSGGEPTVTTTPPLAKVSPHTGLSPIQKGCSMAVSSAARSLYSRRCDDAWAIWRQLST